MNEVLPQQQLSFLCLCAFTAHGHDDKAVTKLFPKKLK